MLKITLVTTDRRTKEMSETNITSEVFADRFEDFLKGKPAFAASPGTLAKLLQEFIESY